MALRISLFNIGNTYVVHQCEDELCFSRNATRFPVKSKQETVNSPGLMPKQWGTQTGLPMNLQCK